MANNEKPVILVVDDDPMIGRCLTVFLDGQGYRVIFFTNGNEALAYLENNTVNFLLTDMQMPEMTGIELAQQVKSLFPALPIIVMSGTADGPARDEIFALGADFIAKPFDLADLLKRIDLSAKGGSASGGQPTLGIQGMKDSDPGMKCSSPRMNAGTEG